MPVIDVKHLTKSYTTYKRGAGMKQTFTSFFSGVKQSLSRP
ncbi:hypothetical protein ACFSQ7_35690 [Paenibacillus rhizoplanae]